MLPLSTALLAALLLAACATESPSSTPSPGDAVPIVEAVAGDVQGPFLVSGYYLAGPDGQRLCEALAESFPPQCGGTSVILDGGGTLADLATSTEADVSWSDAPVTIEGEFVDGRFVVS